MKTTSLWRRSLLAWAPAMTWGCTEVLLPRDAPETPQELFDTVWRDFDRYYASFAIRHVDWDDVYTRYRPQVEQSTSVLGLATTIGQMFAELHDPHVELATAPQKVYPSVDPTTIRTYFDVRTVFARYVSGQQITGSGNLHYGAIDADIGYVWIATFDGTWWSNEFDTVIEALKANKAIIVDVRDNGGGNSETAEAIAGRLASARYRFAYTKYRNGPRHDDFSGLTRHDVVPSGARRFTGPVVLLTNRRVASASEHFVLAMRVRPNTEAVGDTTQGGLGNPLVRALPNGWTYRVPQWIEYGAAMEVFESIGIGPTVAVAHTLSDSATGRDPQLEAAIARARLRVP